MIPYLEAAIMYEPSVVGECCNNPEISFGYQG
jgi:hypothetical protein